MFTKSHPLTRSLALALLLAVVVAMLSPLLMLAQPAPAVSPAIGAGAANTAAGKTAAESWAPVISSTLVQLGGLLAHRKALGRLRERVRVLERAFRSLTGADARTLVPAVPVGSLATRAGA